VVFSRSLLLLLLLFFFFVENIFFTVFVEKKHTCDEWGGKRAQVCMSLLALSLPPVLACW
jgi:hypothetical protein